jgi:ankyrin repeat protein
MASRLGLTQIVDELISGAIPGVKDTDMPHPNLLGDLSISSKYPWASSIALKRQLAEEGVSLAAAEGRVELITELASVISPSTLKSKGQGGLAPLLCAAQCGHLDAMDALGRYGASSRATGRDGSTILHMATGLGNKPMVKQILQLEEGPDITAIDNNGYDAIKIAAEGAFYAVLSLLLENGVDKETINKPIPSNNKTPLSLAAEHGHTNIVQLLLAHGADPTFYEVSESSALYQAAKEGDTDIFCMLPEHPAYRILKIGSDSSMLIDLKDGFEGAQGSSAVSQEAVSAVPRATSMLASDDLEACLSVAVEHRQRSIILLLLQYDIQLNRADQRGNTPLHLAARMGFVEVVQIFLDQRCGVGPRNAAQMTPIQLAAQHGHLDVVKALYEHVSSKPNSDPKLKPHLSTEPTLSALEVAAMADQVLVVDYLAQRDVQAAPRALTLASDKWQHAVIHALVSTGKKLDSISDQVTIEAARVALQKHHYGVLNALLTPQLSLELLPRESVDAYYELLYMAIINDDSQAIPVLAQRGFDINRSNKDGEHPLHIAVL